MTDLDRVMARLRGDFIARLPADKELLEVAEAEHDWREVASISHRLAGAAGLFGFPEIGALATRLEEAINNELPAQERSGRQRLLTSLMCEARRGA